MTSLNMGRRLIDEALGRAELVRITQERGRWSIVVREAQEAVELLLKGALRLVVVEPTRTHDVAQLLRRESARFPGWFDAQIDRLADISTAMAGDRGVAFYGPQELFDEADARRAVEQLDDVAGRVTRLLDAHANGSQPADRLIDPPTNGSSGRGDD